MTEPGTDLVQKAGGLSQFIQQYEGDFSAIVPDHVPVQAFVGLAISQVRTNKDLREAASANPGALIVALRQVAAWGHLPVKGTASLVPYYSRTHKRWTITPIEEVDGVRDRIFRAGAVRSLHHELVRQKEVDGKTFRLIRGSLPFHEYDPFESKQQRGPLMGVYAWAIMRDGSTSHVSWMNYHEVTRHRAMSASVKGSKGTGGNFWGPEWPNEGINTEAMWIKTIYHDLERYVPSSAAYREQYALRVAGANAPMQGRDDAVAAYVRDNPASALHDLDPDVYDAEIVDEQASGAPGGGEPWPPVAQPGDGPPK